MSAFRPLSVLIALLLGAAIPAQNADRVHPGGPSISPFRAMRPVDDGLEVQVDDDTWFALESLDGIDTATLLAQSRDLAGNNWWKRLTEDLPALLDAMGHDVGTTVDLNLRDTASGQLLERLAVPMTGEKRRLLWHANKRGGPALVPAAARSATLAPDAVAADLAELRLLLDERFSYRHRRDVDLDALLARARRRLGDGLVERTALAAEVDRILRAFGDGHSRLGAGQLAAADYFTPFLLQRARGGYVAFLPDRSQLLDRQRPFVEAIDGVPLERWHTALRERARQGSQSMIERDIERGLRDLQSLRREIGVDESGHVRVTVRGEAGAATIEVPVAPRRPAYGAWPHTQSRAIDENVGYLRLASMTSDPEFLDGIDRTMQSFRSCKALVVDVRGNGGGSRDALRRLFPYLLGADEGPQVVNVAAVLLAARPAGTDPDDELLADRSMHRADWSGWTEAQRAAVAAFAAGFRPEWQPPAGKFSAFHYLVLDHGDNDKAFPFAGKVAVLLDRGCFSATDVFLAALATRPNVVLVGTTSSGGSGRARGYRLARSGIALQLSSMASFRPDGRLFDGRGIAPDLACEVEPGDLLQGGTDTVLDAALRRLAQ